MAAWNSGGQVIQVVIVSGDKDASGFASTMSGFDDWIAIPFDGNLDERKTAIEPHVPCTGYPTPGVINAKTGAVIDADAWGKVDDTNFAAWVAAC
jgi:hypothetical protein